MLLRNRNRRSAAVVVESAIVYPVLFLLTLLVMIMGIGVFRYQEVSFLAHEGARYASVRGGQRYGEMNIPAVTEAQIAAYIRSFNLVASGASANNLTITVQLNVVTVSSGSNVVTATSWDASDKSPTTVGGTTGTTVRRNTVMVTVTQNWTPEFFFSTPITLTSTARVPMQY